MGLKWLSWSGTNWPNWVWNNGVWNKCNYKIFGNLAKCFLLWRIRNFEHNDLIMQGKLLCTDQLQKVQDMQEKLQIINLYNYLICLLLTFLTSELVFSLEYIFHSCMSQLLLFAVCWVPQKMMQDWLNILKSAILFQKLKIEVCGTEQIIIAIFVVCRHWWKGSILVYWGDVDNVSKVCLKN